MLETLVQLPFSFWFVAATLFVGALWASEKIGSGLGLPMLAVLGTATAWYVLDPLYNGYEDYSQEFNSDILGNAWWQVSLFLVSFCVLAPYLHSTFNIQYLSQRSSICKMLQSGTSDEALQERLRTVFRATLAIWAALAVYAAIRLGTETPFYFFPFLDHKADPWARGRFGEGSDALLSLATYLQVFVAACFGVLAALLTNKRIRFVSVLFCTVTWPYFIFDRTRNVMLSSMLPGMLSWAFFRLRGGWWKKLAVLASLFLLINAWFGFVLENRSKMTITDALQEKGFDLTGNAEVHHYGLNMFEELCWINSLMNSGQFQPNWGERYWAEVVSPVPRAVWPGKPAVGIDYAIARGFSYAQGDGGVSASLSTGMIGQGVVNFGTILGPLFAALLMGIWTCILARLDLRHQVELNCLGLILTFNLGRDITLLTLYTFLFGALALWIAGRMNRSNQQQLTSQNGRQTPVNLRRLRTY